MIYMDNAATTKISPAAARELFDTMMGEWGNPSSHHQLGYQAKNKLKECRKSIAKNLGANPYEIYFTSGGTEADNWALEAAARYGERERIGKKHIISTTFEHHAILHKLKDLEMRGFEITLLKPTFYGQITERDLNEAIRPDTLLVSIMSVNNEIGSIQNIESLGKIAKTYGALFHTDAVQGVPHIIYHLNDSPIDMLSVSAHKFNGPRGTGFLYVKKGTPLESFIYGGAQENGFRAGTENLPAIAGMAVALSERKKMIQENTLETMAKKEYLLNCLYEISGEDNFILNGNLSSSIPTTLNFCIRDIDGETLLALLSSDDVYCSAGSACSAGDPNPSHVLLAIGASEEVAKNSIRLSFDYNTTWSEIREVIEKIKKSVGYIRGV